MTDNQNKWRSFANQTQKETKTEKSSIPSFPNYLYRKDEKKGDQKTEGPTGVSEPIPKVGQSLSFSEHEDIPFLHQGDHQIKDNLHGQEEQTNVFPSFRQLSSETQAQKNRRNDWNDYLWSVLLFILFCESQKSGFDFCFIIFFNYFYGKV